MKKGNTTTFLLAGLAVLLVGSGLFLRSMTFKNESTSEAISNSAFSAQSSSSSSIQTENGLIIPSSRKADSMKTQWIDPIPQELEEIPAAYKTPMENGGRLEDLRYQTWESDSYVLKTTPLTKRAVVYIPAVVLNKDTASGSQADSKQSSFDVFFAMHGGWANETTILGTPESPDEFKNVLDHLIAEKKMKPMIIVCPTYNNLSNEDSADYSLAIRLTAQFPRELVNDLLPAVVNTYPTYAKSDQAADLKAARDHFGYGGFSMGSVSTWQVFMNALEYFSVFLPSSGNAGFTGSMMAKAVRAQNIQPNEFFVFGMTGTKDFAAQAFVSQLQSMVDQPDMFIYTNDGLSGNVALRVADGNAHDHHSMIQYLYNGLKWIGQGDLIEDTGVFTKDTTVSQVLHDPAFKGFSRMLFPVDPGYMSGTTLGDLDFAWYSEIDPTKTVEILNFMKEAVLSGQTIFYDIYTEDEKRRNPDLENTGLFFFKGMPDNKTAFVSAGGGFAYVAAMHDSFPVCLELSKMGYNAFSVIYRPGAQTACEDLSRAIAFVFEHADELQVDPYDYSLWGGSAGGRMSAWVSEMGTAAFGARPCPKPAADIIQYTGLRDVSLDDVPTYMIVGTNDSIAYYRTMENRAAALRKLGIDAECRVVPGLRHGFGLGTGTAAEGWIEDAVTFWQQHMKS